MLFFPHFVLLSASWRNRKIIKLLCKLNFAKIGFGFGKWVTTGLCLFLLFPSHELVFTRILIIFTLYFQFETTSSCFCFYFAISLRIAWSRFSTFELRDLEWKISLFNFEIDQNIFYKSSSSPKQSLDGPFGNPFLNLWKK